MENLKYILVVVLVAMSVFSTVLCLIRGRGTSHKKLVIFASLLFALAAVCFGGEAMLNHFGMGWRCAPFNLMLMLCAILSVVTLWRSMNELLLLEASTSHALIACGFISTLLVMMITLISAFAYFQFSSWQDSLSSYDGQTIVCANDMHGGSCAWRYYDHVNGLVHGTEITRDGWWGPPPFKS